MFTTIVIKIIVMLVALAAIFLPFVALIKYLSAKAKKAEEAEREARLKAERIAKRKAKIAEAKRKAELAKWEKENPMASLFLEAFVAPVVKASVDGCVEAMKKTAAR